jgi:hypothetical protein
MRDEAQPIAANVAKLPEVFAIATRKNVMQVTDRIRGHFYLHYLMKRRGFHEKGQKVASATS